MIVRVMAGGMGGGRGGVAGWRGGKGWRVHGVVYGCVGLGAAVGLRVQVHGWADGVGAGGRGNRGWSGGGERWRRWQRRQRRQRRCRVVDGGGGSGGALVVTHDRIGAR